MNSRIKESQIAAACSVASRVYAGHLTTAEGVNLLASQDGLNEASAHDFIYDYKRLMEGKVFQRAMSAPAMRHFIEQIFAEHGEQQLVLTLTALRAHIEYYEGHYKTTMRSMRSVADDLQALIKEPSNAAEVERTFEIAIAKALRDPQPERLRRLANASEMPKTISVQSTVFVRNPDVVAEALLRASGVCERCNCEAPFRRAKDGTPYLEVHHKVRLANGGKDSLENAIALCPNCHRETHYGFK